MTACANCGQEACCGVHTNGDPHGDAKHVGIVTDRSRFYCPDCEKNGLVPDLCAAIDKAFSRAGKCGYLTAKFGRCPNPKPCRNHNTQTCWKCGARAMRSCAEGTTFVCWTPECREHPHREAHDTHPAQRAVQRAVPIRGKGLF